MSTMFFIKSLLSLMYALMSSGGILSYTLVQPRAIPLTVFQTTSKRVCSEQCTVLMSHLTDENIQQVNPIEEITDDLSL